MTGFAHKVRGWLAVEWKGDQVGVVLFPDRLIITRVRGGLHLRLKHREIIEVAPAAAGSPVWQPALKVLAEKVMDGTLSRANVSLILSSHFVQYTLVPWNELLRSETEQLAYARQRFVRVHGDSAQGWMISLSQAGPHESRLACAVPEKLVDALNQIMSPIGTRYVSLQPHLMVSFNRCRSRLGLQPGWFVVVEPGLACLALLQDRKWQSVRAVRMDSNWSEQLPNALAREQCLVDTRADCELVSVFAPDLPAAAALEDGRWKIEDLSASLPHTLMAAGDATVATAAGV